MAKGQSKEQLIAENRFLRKNLRDQSTARVIDGIVKNGSYVACAYFAYLSIDSLSGKSTQADISINASAEATVSRGDSPSPHSGPDNAVAHITVAGALTVAVLAIIYGRWQARLRRQVIEQFHPYQVQHEGKVDPRRTTSGLTKSGQTRPEDL